MMKTRFSPLLISVIAMICVMALTGVFEVIEQFTEAYLGNWASHVLTIFFASLAAFGVARRLTRISSEQSARLDRALAKQLQTVLENIHVGVLLSDGGGDVMLHNSRFESITGFARDEVRSIAECSALLQADPELRIGEGVDDAAREMDMRIVSRGGAHRHLQVSTSEILHEGRRLFLTTLLDRTDRKHMEHELRTSEQRMRSILDNMGEGLGFIDARESFVLVNRAAEAIFGVPDGTLAGRFIGEFLSTEEMAHVMNETALRLEGKTSSYEITITRPDGGRRILEITASPWNVEDQYQGAIGLFRDITSRKAAEERLRIFEHTFHSVNDAINIAALDDTLQLVNPAFEKLYGYTAEEVKGRQSDILWSGKTPGEITAQILPATLQSGWQGELYNRRKDGSDFPVFLSTSAVRDTAGRVVAFVGMARDISEQKRVEATLHDTIASLHARNDELDAYSRTVAHDLKNPLASISGFTDLLLTDHLLDLGPTCASYIEHISWAADKMRSIIDEILLLSSLNRSAVNTGPVNIRTMTLEVLQRLPSLVQKSKADIVVDETLPMAVGYAPWVEEILMNYLVNAIKYGGAPPRIRVGGEPTDSGFVRYWVRDNGKGIAPEDAGMLFKPFVKLNQLQIDGHGLGLSIVQQIIGKLHGEVGVVPAPGGGCEFYFTLPAIHEMRVAQ